MASDWIIAAAAGITAIATGFIAWFTKLNRDMVRLQKRSLASQKSAEQNARSPILSLKKDTTHGIRSAPTITARFMIRNVGFGPALNIRFRYLGGDQAIAPLAAGEEWQVVFQANYSNGVTSLKSNVQILCNDIFGRQWTTEILTDLTHNVIVLP